MNLVSNIDTLPNEEWREVKGFGGQFAVSSVGRVASKRKVGRWRIMKPNVTKAGYLRVNFHIRPHQYPILVHRLVAEAFIDNPSALPFINHKDENGLNNNVSNLEWCDKLYNNTYGTALSRAHATRVRNGSCIGAMVYDIEGRLVNTYGSVYEAAKALGARPASVYSCVHGRHLTCCGVIVLSSKGDIRERLRMIREASHQCHMKKLLNPA